MHARTLLFFLLCSAQAFAQVKFQAINSVELPTTPQELAKGDFNNDGLTDFATANFNSLANQQVTILLNTGTGTFSGSNVRSFASTTSVLDVGTGDFNEDGNLDVVVCSQPNDNFSLLLGDGTGNLGAPTNFSAGDTPNGIAVGDFNKDNNLDVVVTCRGTPSEFHVFPGNGNGTFGTATVVTLNNVWDVAVADFNGDTNPDLAFNMSNNAVQIWLGNGSGTTFTLQHTITSVNGTENITAANLDSDADIDIVSGGTYALNNGNGTFAASVALTQSVNEYAVGDVNKDGNPDIIASDHNQNYMNMRVYIGNGAGAFTLLGKFEGNILFHGVEIADVNNDTNPDVIGVGTWATAKLADIYLGDGTGYFAGVTKYVLPPDPRTLTKGDFNEDGILDLAIAHNVGNFISIYLGFGVGRFTKTATNIPVGTPTTELHTFDYNKDGHTDLVTFNIFSPQSTTILTGNGTGTFTVLTTITVPTGSRGIAIADMNKDTFVDIVIAGGSSGAIHLYNGTGSGFSAPSSVSTTGMAEDVEAADFDGDGNLDLAAAYTEPDDFLVLTGNGSGGFTEGTRYSVPATGTPGNIRISDFNNDGSPDVAVSGDNATEYFFTKTASGFTANELVPTSGASVGKEVIDMDGDGFKDIIFGSQGTNSSSAGVIRCFKGNGNGTFSSSTNFYAPLFEKTHSGGVQFITHDFNADGKPDIASIFFNMYEDNFGILINEGSASACISPSGTITPSASVCVGQNVTITASASGTAPFTYQWKKGGTDISGATSASLIFTSITTTDAGNYTCVITNSCGNFTTSASTLTVTASITPPTVTGSSSCIAAALTLTASGGTNGQYRWYDVASGGTPFAGQFNSTYTTPVLSSTATYYVSINNGACESSRTPVMASIAPLGKPVISSSQPITGGIVNICDDQSVTLSGPNGFAEYTWSDGETTQQITVDASSTHTLIVEDAGGCVSPASDAVNVVVNTYPLAEITANGMELIASPGDSYQWYRNGEEVAGAMNQTFTFNAIESGTYRVDVTENGCTSSSETFAYLITKTELEKRTWEIYPNPFSQNLFIRSAYTPEEIEIELTDALGRVWKKKKTISNSSITVDDLHEGHYVLTIRTPNQKLKFRVVKLP
ncbi:MAG TPA: FG-GAP-like repeat-containing protein [Ohtaekwangia sp.]